VLEPLGLTTTEMCLGERVFATYVESDAHGATAVPGVWVAGNVADPRAQVITAAAAGLTAAAAINADLVQEDTALAVARMSDRQTAETLVTAGGSTPG
jgi:thioredoxin reductase (NADPH)